MQQYLNVNVIKNVLSLGLCGVLFLSSHTLNAQEAKEAKVSYDVPVQVEHESTATATPVKTVTPASDAAPQKETHSKTAQAQESKAAQTQQSKTAQASSKKSVQKTAAKKSNSSGNKTNNSKTNKTKASPATKEKSAPASADSTHKKKHRKSNKAA